MFIIKAIKQMIQDINMPLVSGKNSKGIGVYIPMLHLMPKYVSLTPHF